MRHDGAYINYRESNLLKAAQCPAGGRTVNFHPSEAQAVDSCGINMARTRPATETAEQWRMAVKSPLEPMWHDCPNAVASS